MQGVDYYITILGSLRVVQQALRHYLWHFVSSSGADGAPDVPL